MYNKHSKSMTKALLLERGNKNININIDVYVCICMRGNRQVLKEILLRDFLPSHGIKREEIKDN
jgi:GrpB-like predicted nucleotidyltransferase (UPF0157 family)